METAPDPNDLIGPAELRERLGISEATYYRWIKSGRLDGVRVGGRWRFPRQIIDELLGGDDGVSGTTRALRRALDACAGWLQLDESRREEMRDMKSDSQSASAIVDLLIERAVANRASSVHIEPVADGLAVRERIHGIMHAAPDVLPEEARPQVVHALKTRAGMAIDIIDRPQDARFFATIDGRKVDIHCALFPTALGESFTLRVLDPAQVTLSFSESGFRPALRQRILETVRAPKGVFIVNGPTGCGKTTTIYSLLSELNDPGLKIMTVEDPVEFHIDGLLQAPLQPQLSFRAAMLAMLRADLDIGFVAELRDGDTMQLLFQMAATGHLMFSTLHADDPASALIRLMETGPVSSRMLVDQLLGVLDQRLVPKVCPDCRVRRPMTNAEADALGLSGRADDYEATDVKQNPGCRKCGGRGICGQTVVGELWTITPGVRAALEGPRPSADTLRPAARADGIETMREDMLARVAAGDVLPRHAAAVLGRRGREG